MSGVSHRNHLKDYLSSHKRSSGIENQKQTRGDGAIPKSGPKHSTFSSKQQIARSASTTKVRTTVSKQHLTIHSIPDEILLKVFGLLNAGDLVIVSQVCHWWHGLANDESLWRRIFKENVAAEKKPSAGGAAVDPTSTNYLKQLYIRSCVRQRNKKFLRTVKKKNPYTGTTPATDIKKTLVECGIQWQLTCVDHHDKEHSFVCTEVTWHQMSLSLHWNDLDNKSPSQVKVVNIHACIPLFFDSKTGTIIKNGPYQKSLMLSTKVNTVLQSSTLVGGDDLVNTYSLSPGLLVATWKADGYLAFMSAGFHYHELINRCFKGSPSQRYLIPAPLALSDDVDPHFGMHGYTCTVELRSLKTSWWDNQFRNLDCPVGYLGATSKGAHLPSYSKFSLVSHPDKILMQKKILFPWRTFAFSGKMKNMCWVDITVTDEKSEIFWAVSNPVSVKTITEASTAGAFDESYVDVLSLDLTDDTGKLHLQIGQTDDKRTYIIEAHLGVSLQAINSRFGTDYKNKSCYLHK